MELLTVITPVQSVIVLSLIIVLGLFIGHIKICGICLGVGGVLFSGLIIGHFGIQIHQQVLDFAREFGLILFVFTVGLQVGPGFVDSLRNRGLILNVMAMFIVITGALLCVGCFFLFNLPLPVAVGIFSGAVTNTPALAAASQALTEIGLSSEQTATAFADLGMGYAVAYPFGILGVIIVMLLVRAFFHINTTKEVQIMEEQRKAHIPSLRSMTLRMSNPALFGKKLSELTRKDLDGAVISRIGYSENNVVPSSPDLVLAGGMLVHAVGSEDALNRLQLLIGPDSGLNIDNQPGEIAVRYLRLTNRKAVGKTLKHLHLQDAHGVTVTRIKRTGLEFSPTPDMILQFGDSLTVVGEHVGLNMAEQIIGNSQRALHQPQILPIFVGILLGTLLGSVPIAFPGLPAGIKLGIAGGPLLVAIILSRMHSFAGMIWYLSDSANLALREVGIVLFLSCVGLHAGSEFINTVIHGSGMLWIGVGMIITLIPLLLASVLGRIVLRCNYVSMCGLLSGSMTDPPALAFAMQNLATDSPATVYATVYPLTMILRILIGQLLVLILSTL